MEIIAYVVGSLLLGLGTGRFMLKRFYQSEEVAAQAKAKKILRDAEENAEILRKNKLLEAKEKFLQMKSEHEQEINEKNNQANQDKPVSKKIIL